MLRQLAERATHRVVFRRRLPPDLGSAWLYVSTEGGLRYARLDRERFDPMLFGAVRRYVHTGDVVWDIGSNVGLFSIAAASRAGRSGRVLAVEADTCLVDLLRRSVRANDRSGTPLAPISVLPVAVSDDVRVAELCIAKRNRATNYLAGHGTTQTGGERERQLVPTLTIDLLLEHFPPPDVLKIDVEGAEVAVLTGATKVLAHRPTVLCEVASANAMDVHEVLRPFGYRYLDLGNARETDLPSDDLVALPSAVLGGDRADPR
jgi:FkbM family methyltransferase